MPNPRPHPKRLRRLVLPGLVVAVILSVLYLFDPAQHGFYPQCPLYHWVGLHCASCGALRALHACTHGHWRSAWQHNPLVLLTPPLLCAAWLCRRRAIRLILLGGLVALALALLFWRNRPQATPSAAQGVVASSTCSRVR